MDLTQLKELGIAGISVGAIATIFYLVAKALLSEIKQARTDYSCFVNNNNHKITEIVEKATATMVETKDAIGKHNEVLDKLLDKLK